MIDDFLKDVPNEDRNKLMMALVVMGAGCPVGRKLYDITNEMVDKYPDFFPQETAWRKVPCEVHEAYQKEYDALFPPEPLPLLPDGTEPMGWKEVEVAVRHQAELRAKAREIEPLTKESYQKSLDGFLARIEQDQQDEVRKRNLWDKHYKKYKVDYRK